MGLREDYAGELQEKTTIITNANTDTQIFLVPWTPPFNKQGVLEAIAISNQQASAAAVVKIWDADITSGLVAGTTKPAARGSAAAPLLPPINVPAGTQVWIGVGSCPNIKIAGGLAAQATQTTVTVYAQVVVY